MTNKLIDRIITALVVVTFLIFIFMFFWYMLGNSPTFEQFVVVVFGFYASWLMYLDKKITRLGERMHDNLTEIKRRMHDNLTGLERRLSDKIDNSFGGKRK